MDQDTINRAVDAALDLRGELWARLCEAARDPRVAAMRLSAEPVTRTTGPRAVGGRALGLKLDVWAESRWWARRLSADLGCPAPRLGTRDDDTPRAISIVADLITQAGPEEAAGAAAWLLRSVAAARMVTGAAVTAAPPSMTSAPRNATTACPACGSRSLELAHDWAEARVPYLVCRCTHRVALGDMIPRALPPQATETGITLPAAAAEHGVPRATLYRLVSAAGLEPVGSRHGDRLYQRVDVDALIAQRGRVAALRPAAKAVAT